MASPFIGGRFTALGPAGVVPGAALYTYAAGTLDLQATYTGATGAQANSNPVICDAAGQADVWLGAAAYRMRLYTAPISAGGVLLWDRDQLQSLDALTGADGAGRLGFGVGRTYAPGTVGFELAQHASVRSFGAVGDGVTDDTAAIAAAEAAGADVFLPAGTYKVAGSHTFGARFWGPGELLYSGRGPITFTGGGVNNLSTSGTFAGPRRLEVLVEISALGPPETWRWSADGGATWVSQNVEILPDDTEVITPLTVSTVPYPLGHTGVSIAFGSTGAHAVGARWSFRLEPNPKALDVGTALYSRGALLGHADGRRTVSFGQGNFAGGSQVSFENVGLGVDCLQDVSTGYANVAVGVRAGQRNRTGFLNTHVGVWAGRDGVTAQQNTAVGGYCMVGVKGSNNTAVGTDSLAWIDQSADCTAVGVQALHGNDETKAGTSQRCTAVGVQALRDAESGSYNTALGAYSMSVLKAGAHNTGVGYSSLNAVTGNANTAVGSNAGTVVTQASRNVFVGAGAGTGSLQKLDAQNSIAIGADAATTASNQIVLGTTEHVETVLNGDTHPNLDGVKSLGAPSARWSQVYAASGAINTSDANEKQDFAPASEAEKRVARAIRGKLGRFRFRSAVEKKGAAARLHFGTTAQDVALAFEAEGLDPGAYALFCSDTWQDPDGTQRTRLGLRYDELAAFILCAL